MKSLCWHVVQLRKRDTVCRRLEMGTSPGGMSSQQSQPILTLGRDDDLDLGDLDAILMSSSRCAVGLEDNCGNSCCVYYNCDT